MSTTLDDIIFAHIRVYIPVRTGALSIVPPPAARYDGADICARRKLLKSLQLCVGALAVLVAACGGAAPGDGGATAPPGGEVPGGEIAFVSFRDGDQEIYVMNPDGSDQRNLTNDPGDDFNPDWSPDGKRVAFASNRTGQTHIYVMDANGSNLRQLTTDVKGGLNPRWSRDGAMIAFTQGASIAVMDADGSNLTVILEAEPEATAAACRAGSFAGGWSPNDEEITYYAASISRQEGQVCTIKADGSNVQVIVAEPGTYQVEPVFSPDGRFIVYRAIVEGVHDIWVVDLETGERTNVTDDQDLDIEPGWSPDGEWIVFASLRPGEPHFALFIRRRDGSDVRRLTDDPAKDAYPVWAP